MPEIAVKGVIVDQGTFSKVALVDEIESGKKPSGWGFPGGRGFDEEQAKNALIREVFEETGIVVKILDLLREEELEYEAGVKVKRFFFLCQALNQGDSTRCVHKETRGWQWFSINQLPEEMYPSHRTIIEDGGGRLRPEIDHLLWYRKSSF